MLIWKGEIMNINKYIILVTFIPWILIVFVSVLSNLNNENYQKFSFKYLGKNFFKIFRLDTLLLILCFWYFASFHKTFVDKYLFSIMCLYLFVNFFYEKRSDYQTVVDLFMIVTSPGIEPGFTP